MNIKLQMDGAPSLMRQLKLLQTSFPKAAAAALYQEGFAVQAVAQDFCPVDESRLEKSAYTAPPIEENGAVVVEVGFGTVYAVPQHEHTEWHHPKKGEAKYLQKAMDRRRSGLLERMVARILENVRAGRGVTSLKGD